MLSLSRAPPISNEVFCKSETSNVNSEELEKPGKRLEVIQSTTVCQNIHVYLHSQTPPLTANTHTLIGTFSYTHKDAHLIIQGSLCSHLLLVSKVIFFPSLLLLFLQFLSHPPHFLLTCFLISYLFCLFSILCPACCVYWIWSAFHV